LGRYEDIGGKKVIDGALLSLRSRIQAVLLDSVFSCEGLLLDFTANDFAALVIYLGWTTSDWLGLHGAI